MHIVAVVLLELTWFALADAQSSMPYPIGLDGHLNSSRFRNSEPLSSESVFAYFREPPSRPSATRMTSSGSINALNDARSSLHRRFTTNTLASPISQQRGQPAEQPPPVPDLSFAVGCFSLTANGSFHCHRKCLPGKFDIELVKNTITRLSC